MITALPDVQHITLTNEDEFIILACDGIWNYLNSQETVDFVRSRYRDELKLSCVIEQVSIYICLFIKYLFIVNKYNNDQSDKSL